MHSNRLHNKKVLITAGPTIEAIDPVQYISNHSSGKMGYAIAEKFLEKGSHVFLVSGPVNIQLQHPRLKVVKVNSASEMYLACCHFFEEVDIAVFAAAVADYRPEKVAEKKIKKDESHFILKMTKNVDIAYEFGRVKTHKQMSVGFAIETHDEVKHAIGKLDKKNFDMVLLNPINNNNATSGYDINKITVIKDDFSKKELPLKSKTEVAKDIVNEIAATLSAHEKHQLETVLDYETMYR